MFKCGVILSFIVLFGLVNAWEPTCSTTGFQIIPKLDCSGYYLCVYGKPIMMPNCPPGSIFSRTAHVCVPTNSIYNDCADFIDGRPTIPDSGPLTVAEQCQMDSNALIPHPTECQAYYNCSMRYESVPRLFEQHLMECPYPEYFNPETKNCDHFEKVKCGIRQEFKNACDYRRNKCPVAHCIPCSVLSPSCEGKANGIHSHESKQWSPYYVFCYQERYISTEMCKPDNNGRTQLFHPEKNECVSLENIPREHGGMMPNCEGKADGFYLDEFGRCNMYVACKGGKFLNTVTCAPGEVFDAIKLGCKPKKEACGPCGDSDLKKC